jgi:hypothetical protein
MRNEEGIQAASVHHGPGCFENKSGRNGTDAGKVAIPQSQDRKLDGDELPPGDVAMLRQFFELLDRWERESDELDISNEARQNPQALKERKAFQDDER